jgi:hypothetical protein
MLGSGARASNSWRARPRHMGSSAYGSGFRRWRSIVERAVRAHGVVVAPPGLDQHLGFGQAEEQFAIEKFMRSLLLKLSQ